MKAHKVNTLLPSDLADNPNFTPHKTHTEIVLWHAVWKQVGNTSIKLYTIFNFTNNTKKNTEYDTTQYAN